jgi:hypothetical protein
MLAHLIPSLPEQATDLQYAPTNKVLQGAHVGNAIVR